MNFPRTVLFLIQIVTRFNNVFTNFLYQHFFTRNIVLRTYPKKNPFFLGNKGGVGISFDFLSTSLCFINCHLTSGNEDVRKAKYVELLFDSRMLRCSIRKSSRSIAHSNCFNFFALTRLLYALC